MNHFYVTTPIYYATDKPHIGHAYTTVAADVLARYWSKKLSNDQVFFSVGTDEHGQKIAESAVAAGQQPRDHVDALVPRYKAAWEALNIQPSDFIRTTEQRHIDFVTSFLTQLKSRDYIYKGQYEGLYCVGCECYITESELLDGHCPDHPTLTPEQRSEENYFFALTKLTDQLIQLIESDELAVKPVERKNEILSRLRDGVRDISISRPGLDWGIPIPWDESHTTYVWIEALLNYASIIAKPDELKYWPPTVQLMAKDILWFHAVIWPAMLLANELPLPKTIFVHGFFTIDGQKMSKTLGNVIDPVELVNEWGTDAARYFLLSLVPFGSDGDIQASRFAEIYESDLANGLGNLLNRTVTLMNQAGLDLKSSGVQSISSVEGAIEKVRLDDGLKTIMKSVKHTNQYLESKKPWELIKYKDTNLKIVLQTAYDQLETIAVGLAPYLPQTSETILTQLKSRQATPLFPRRS